jgi:uridine monophosphate synthetase
MNEQQTQFTPSFKTTRLPFLKRAHLTRQPCTQKLFRLMEEKKSNLAIALDLELQADLLKLADRLGPYICVLKTHVDILRDFTPDFGPKLKALAQKHNFLIFEDRKFADIGQTSSLQYRSGIYQISSWADLINAHPIAGPGIIEGLKSSNLLLLAEMSSQGTLAKGAYTKSVVKMAQSYPDTVAGLISLKHHHDSLIHFTPGVQLLPGKDALGQRYRTVDEIITKNRSDIIIVGRGITHAANPEIQAKLYQDRAWQAYLRSS